MGSPESSQFSFVASLGSRRLSWSRASDFPPLAQTRGWGNTQAHQWVCLFVSGRLRNRTSTKCGVVILGSINRMVAGVSTLGHAAVGGALTFTSGFES